MEPSTEERVLIGISTPVTSAPLTVTFFTPAAQLVSAREKKVATNSYSPSANPSNLNEWSGLFRLLLEMDNTVLVFKSSKLIEDIFTLVVPMVCRRPPETE